ncbi:MAG TPA: hypothetical protein VLX68_14945 [Chitinivibrionales bacterium]|nr:hypothetical protein [Chitinivibrionales bacterium]
MKRILCILMIAAVANLALPQAKPVLMPKTAMHDTMQMEEKGLVKDSARLSLHERQLGLEERAGKYALDKERYEHNFREEMEEQGRPWGMGMYHARFPMHGMYLRHVVMGLIFCAVVLIINILLTILVSLDMAKLNRFNGLWIPILLVAGIPATALYALFRIGDIVLHGQTK